MEPFGRHQVGPPFRHSDTVFCIPYGHGRTVTIGLRFAWISSRESCAIGICGSRGKICSDLVETAVRVWYTRLKRKDSLRSR
jgi:hypothetical protein